MKALQSALLGILLIGAGAALAAAQTTDLGQGVFTSSMGDIMVTIDAGLAIDKINSPYVMFVIYMVPKGEISAAVDRNDVTMTWSGQDYKMPSLVEWRKNYKNALGDMAEYRHMGHESLVLSQLSTYKFPTNQDYFPILGRGPLPTDVGSMSDSIGFRSKIYFKNPGFKRGDQIVISVKDKNNPNITGSCAVILR